MQKKYYTDEHDYTLEKDDTGESMKIANKIMDNLSKASNEANWNVSSNSRYSLHSNFLNKFLNQTFFFCNILCRKSAQDTHIACANTKCTQKTSIIELYKCLI